GTAASVASCARRPEPASEGPGSAEPAGQGRRVGWPGRGTTRGRRRGGLPRRVAARRRKVFCTQPFQRFLPSPAPRRPRHHSLLPFSFLSRWTLGPWRIPRMP
ncbi:unnamed protein product, partial [Gulo gulo]